MAEKVLRVLSEWSDEAGAKTRSIFLIKQSLDVDGSLVKADTAADIKAIIDKLEAISKLKFVQVQVVFPVDTSGWSVKSDASDFSSVSKQAWLEFLGQPGDSGKATKTRIFIPSPKDAVLGGNNTRLDMGHADVISLRDAVLEKVLTLGGTNLSAAGASNVRIRRTRK